MNNGSIQIDLEEFNKRCENDYRTCIISFFKLFQNGDILKKSKLNQSAGSEKNKKPLKYQKFGKFLPKLQISSYDNILKNSTGNLNKNRKISIPSIDNNNGNLSIVNINDYPTKKQLSLPNVDLSIVNINDYLSYNSTKQVRLPNILINIENEIVKPPKFIKLGNNQVYKVDKNKKALLHECTIYEYLKIKSQKFINDFTCFSKCSGDILYLRDGGYSLKELFKIRYNSTQLFGLILKKLLEKLFILHSLGVVHNNLDCDTVLVGKEDKINTSRNSNPILPPLFMPKNIHIRFIDFSLAKILKYEQTPDLDYLKQIFIYYNNVYLDLLGENTK